MGVLVVALGLMTACQGEGKGSSPMSPSREELKRRLSAEQFEVVCNEATEPPFQNAYWNHHEPGIYVDVATGEPLFSSLDKFDSGTGWPSFTRPIDEGAVTTREDQKLGMSRSEVRSNGGDSHLGHLFRDGPAPTGLRYCINSASLRFVPVSRLEAEGLGRFLPLFESRETAVLAGGCFWGMEEILRRIPGVLSTRVGYTGGSSPEPTYGDVKTGETGHAEAVEVVFDPARLSYATLLEQYFFRMHDPTQINGQGNDHGTQYRSAIFYESEAQRVAAEEAKRQAARSGRWTRPIATAIIPAGKFYPAEEYHQKYLLKHPEGYSCHWMRK